MKTKEECEQIVIDLMEDNCRQIQKDTNVILGFLEEFKDNEIGEFMRKFIDLHQSKEILVYGIFRGVIDFSEHRFIESFGSFIEDYLLGDWFFVVEWRKNLSNGPALIIGEDGEPKYEIVQEKSEYSYPVVLENEIGTQDAKVLLDIIEYEEKRWMELDNTLKSFINL